MFNKQKIILSGAISSAGVAGFMASPAFATSALAVSAAIGAAALGTVLVYAALPSFSLKQEDTEQEEANPGQSSVKISSVQFDSSMPREIRDSQELFLLLDSLREEVSQFQESNQLNDVGNLLSEINRTERHLTEALEHSISIRFRNLEEFLKQSEILSEKISELYSQFNSIVLMSSKTMTRFVDSAHGKNDLS